MVWVLRHRPHTNQPGIDRRTMRVVDHPSVTVWSDTAAIGISGLMLIAIAITPSDRVVLGWDKPCGSLETTLAVPSGFSLNRILAEAVATTTTQNHGFEVWFRVAVLSRTGLASLRASGQRLPNVARSLVQIRGKGRLFTIGNPHSRSRNHPQYPGNPLDRHAQDRHPNR